MSKVLPFQRLLDFQLEEDGVRTKDGFFTFYRYYPPNMDIMTDGEVQAEIEKLPPTPASGVLEQRAG